MSRLHLDLSESVRQELDRLKRLTDAGSLVEVIRRALAVYAFVQDEKVVGHEVFVRDHNGVERQLVLL